MSESQKTDATPKKQKKKGPIRIEAVGPVLILIAAIVAYTIFFFDSHLKYSLESLGYLIHGAEVNIERLDTSFRNASVDIKNIEVTNPERPTHNLFSIETVGYQALWDGLLRGKLVIDRVQVNGIRVASQRARPGQVRPPSTDSGESLLDGAGQELADSLQKENSGNGLGHIAALVGGANPASQLDNIEGSLKSEAYIQDLQKTLQERQDKWAQRLASLGGTAKLTALQNEAKGIKTSGFKSPQELQQSVKKLQDVSKKAQAQIDEYSSAQRDLNKDIGASTASVNQIDKVIQQDIRSLEKQLKIPSLDVGELSRDLFLKQVNGYIAPYRKYIDMAQDYMPQGGTKNKADELTPRERAEGRNYQFGRPNAYPLLWIRRVEIASKADNSELSADLNGTALNFTTDQKLTGVPATIKLSGQTPTVKGIEFSAEMNRLEEVARDQFQLAVASYPINSKSLSNSEDLKLNLREANGRLAVDGVYTEEKLNLKVDNTMSAAKYDVEAKNPEVQQIVSGAVNGIPTIQLKAQASGPLSGLAWKIHSTLGQEIEKAFRGQLQKRLNAARNKVRKYVEDRIAAERSKITGQLDSFKQKIGGQLNGEKAKLEGQRDQAQAKVKSAQDAANAKLRAEQEKARAKAQQEQERIRREAEAKRKAEEERAKKKLEAEKKKELDKLKKKLGW